MLVCQPISLKLGYGILLIIKTAIASISGGINSAQLRRSRLLRTKTKDAIIPAAAGTGKPIKSLLARTIFVGGKSGFVKTLKRANRTLAQRR